MPSVRRRNQLPQWHLLQLQPARFEKPGNYLQVERKIVWGKLNLLPLHYQWGTAVANNVSLSLEQAHELCQAHPSQNKARLFSQCWGCLKYSKNNPEKMCFFNPPDHDGCRFVNNLYTSQKSSIRLTGFDRSPPCDTLTRPKSGWPGEQRFPDASF